MVVPSNFITKAVLTKPWHPTNYITGSVHGHPNADKEHLETMELHAVSIKQQKCHMIQVVSIRFMDRHGPCTTRLPIMMLS